MATEENSSEIVKEMAESVAATNLKSLADAPAFYNNLAYGNAISHQQLMNNIMASGFQSLLAINQAATAKAIESLISTQPSEGAVDVAGAQKLMKGAQTTPPVTAGN